MPENAPEPFKANYDNTTGASRSATVKGIKTYYDTTDHEIYGVVYIKQTSDEKYWVKAYDWLTNNPTNYIKLKEYIKSKRQNETMYPVFSIVQVKQGNKLHESIIVSYDRASTKCYGVIHYDGYFEDVNHTAVNFGHTDISMQIMGQEPENGPNIHFTEAELDKVFSIMFTDGENTVATGNVSTEYLDYVEPKTYKEVLNDKYKNQWEKSDKAELDQLQKMKVLKPLKELPKGKKSVKTKMVRKLKLLETGALDKFKSRLVAKGFTQIFGIDYSESFSPTPTLTILRAVIIIALQFNLELYGIDVKGAYLNAKLSEYIIIEFPEGVTVEGCKYAELLKSLYGLHQAGNDWHKMSDRIIKSFDPRIKQSLAEPCFYYIWTAELIFLMTVHVDDYTIATNSNQYYKDLVSHFKKSVEVEEKGMQLAFSTHRSFW